MNLISRKAPGFNVFTEKVITYTAYTLCADKNKNILLHFADESQSCIMLDVEEKDIQPTRMFAEDFGVSRKSLHNFLRRDNFIFLRAGYLKN